MNNTTIIKKAKKARLAAIKMSALDNKIREDDLEAVAVALLENKEKIIKANEIDLENAKKNNLYKPLLKRLKFDETKLDDVVNCIRSLIKVEDLIGKVIEKRELSKDVYLAAQSTATVVILIGMSKLNEIVSIFKKYNKSEVPTAIIQNGTTKNEKLGLGTINTIEEVVAQKQLSSPAIIVIGEVVKESVKLQSFYERFAFIDL